MTTDASKLAAQLIDTEIFHLLRRVDDLQHARALILGDQLDQSGDPVPQAQLTQAAEPPVTTTPNQPPAIDDGQVDLQDRLLELLACYHGQQVTNGTLASSLGVLQASIPQALKALEAKGEIRREGHTRLRRIFVTAIEDGDQADELDTAAPTALPRADAVALPPLVEGVKSGSDPLAPPPLPSERAKGRG